MKINIDKDGFTGTESPKVDPKGRIVISKIFNLKLYQKIAFLHGVDGKDCFRIASYEYLENKLNEMNKMRAEASSQRDIIIYNRLIEEIERKIEEFYALTVSVTQIDQQNRALIPNVIRKAYDVKFNSEVILKGVRIYINCYPNYEKYDHYISQVQQLNKQKRTK